MGVLRITGKQDAGCQDDGMPVDVIEEFAEPAKPVNTAEHGQPGNIAPSSWWDPTTAGVRQWESAPDETNLNLQFPYSIAVYDAMSRTDPQIGSVLRAIMLSLRRAKWTLDTGEEDKPPTPPPAPVAPPVAPVPPATTGPPATPSPAGSIASAFADTKPRIVRKEVEDFVRTEIGLPRVGETLQDTRTSKVTFLRHLADALQMIVYGFAAFEQIYQFDAKDGRWHLWKLASRPQKTIKHLLVTPEGDLDSIVQQPLPLPTQPNAPFHPGGIPLPAEWLVFYCHERVGADFSGTSILRNCYKNWLIKDVVLRLGAQIVERNGMGIPDVTYDSNGTTTKAEAIELARQLRAGMDSGIAHPQDVKVQILGVTGNLVDPVPFLKYNDEQIAGSALAMFQTLGHDNGARSLGETFLDVFTSSLQAEADNFAEDFTHQVIKPLVAKNFGDDEPYPVLSAGELTATGILNAKELNELVAARLITPDPTLEAFLRTRYDLPDANQPEEAGGAIPDDPPYDGVDPNLPWQQRINQPIPPAPVPPESAARPMLPLRPAPIAASAGVMEYAEWLAARRELLAAEA